jgi:hypothetical protein
MLRLLRKTACTAESRPRCFHLRILESRPQFDRIYLICVNYVADGYHMPDVLWPFCLYPLDHFIYKLLDPPYIVASLLRVISEFLILLRCSYVWGWGWAVDGDFDNRLDLCT